MGRKKKPSKFYLTKKEGAFLFLTDGERKGEGEWKNFRNQLKGVASPSLRERRKKGL